MSNSKTRNSKQKNAKAKKTTVVTLETPLGPCRVDLKDAKDAFDESRKWERSPPTAEERCHEDYLGGTVSKHLGWSPSRQGFLMLTELEPFVSKEWVVDRLTHFIHRGTRETDPSYREVNTGVGKAVEVAIGSTMSRIEIPGRGYASPRGSTVRGTFVWTSASTARTRTGRRSLGTSFVASRSTTTRTARSEGPSSTPT